MAPTRPGNEDEASLTRSVPVGPIGAYDRWSPVTTTPLLPIEMIPQPLHGKSLSRLLKRKLWDVLGRSVRARAEGRCEICGQESTRLDCHEIWSYDDERRGARLVGLKAVCSPCHLSTHMGRATSIGRQHQAIDHLMEVNDWTWDEARPYLAHAMQEYVMRSKNAWVLDVSDLPTIVQSLEAEERIASLARDRPSSSWRTSSGRTTPRFQCGAE